MKNNKGITLIALIITIIVMLILVAVTVSVVVNSDLIGTTKKAKTDTELAYGEDSNMGAVEINGKKYASIEDFEKGIEMIEAGERTTQKMKYTDGTKTAFIPEGFTVSGIETEQKIDNGLVIYEIPEGTTISDWKADTTNNGFLDVREKYNQYVWIPVNETELATYVEKEGDNYKSKSTTYIEPATTSTDAAQNITKEILQKEYNDTIESIIKNGGFYIGRYEGTDVVKQNSSDNWTNGWYGLRSDITSNFSKTGIAEANIPYAWQIQRIFEWADVYNTQKTRHYTVNDRFSVWKPGSSTTSTYYKGCAKPRSMGGRFGEKYL